MKPLGPADPRRVGQYQLLGKLGAGGMGSVYLARSARGRTVAVKLVQPELARQPEFRQRFAQEVDAARRIGKRWTAPVLDCDTEAETPWVATGYVAGPSLHEVVAGSHGKLPERTLLALANGLTQSLRDIHGAGLVHRDLKPSNVLITIDGPRVIDFGIARALEQTGDGLTRTGSAVGSPGFMSPEQCRGEIVTGASDVFCLGSVLAFAATGRTPFGDVHSAMHVLMLRIVQDEKDLSGVPERTREVIARCLAQDPADRPTLDELSELTAEGDLWGEEHADEEPWLPGALIARLGKHAVELLDSEDPVHAPPKPAASPVPAMPAAPPMAPPVTPPPPAQSPPVAPAAQPPAGAPVSPPPPTRSPLNAPMSPPPPALSPMGAPVSPPPPAGSPMLPPAGAPPATPPPPHPPAAGFGPPGTGAAPDAPAPGDGGDGGRPVENRAAPTDGGPADDEPTDGGTAADAPGDEGPGDGGPAAGGAPGGGTAAASGAPTPAVADPRVPGMVPTEADPSGTARPRTGHPEGAGREATARPATTRQPAPAPTPGPAQAPGPAALPTVTAATPPPGAFGPPTGVVTTVGAAGPTPPPARPPRRRWRWILAAAGTAMVLVGGFVVITSLGGDEGGRDDARGGDTEQGEPSASGEDEGEDTDGGDGPEPGGWDDDGDATDDDGSGEDGPPGDIDAEYLGAWAGEIRDEDDEPIGAVRRVEISQGTAGDVVVEAWTARTRHTCRSEGTLVSFGRLLTIDAEMTEEAGHGCGSVYRQQTFKAQSDGTLVWSSEGSLTAVLTPSDHEIGDTAVADGYLGDWQPAAASEDGGDWLLSVTTGAEGTAVTNWAREDVSSYCTWVQELLLADAPGEQLLLGAGRLTSAEPERGCEDFEVPSMLLTLEGDTVAVQALPDADEWHDTPETFEYVRAD